MTGKREGPHSDHDWAAAIARTSGEVDASDAEVAAVAAGRHRKPKTGLILGLAAVLTIVVATDLYLVRMAPPPLPPAEQEVDLRWVIADVVEEVEVFRQAEGRLPTADDLDGLLDEVVSYEVIGNAYRVTAVEGSLRIQYDGSVPLEAWVELRTVDPAAGGS